MDFGYGEAFPHEADMDQLGGVDFAKGCYVGQEVVSRMQHRGIGAHPHGGHGYDGDAAPETGMRSPPVNGKSAPWARPSDGRGLALLRLDRVAEALSHGETLFAGNVPVRPIKPDWATFAFADGANSASTKAAE